MAADGQLVPGSVYFYAPNKGAAFFGTFAFFLSTGYHVWQCLVLQSLAITALIPFASLLYAAGFALRVYSSWNYEHLNVYLASTILLYSAPPIYELANYHMLGRILYYVPYCSPIHPGRSLTTFGALSAIVEILNSMGVAWSINTSVPVHLREVGESMLKASLIIQICVILIFVSFVGWFQHLMHKQGVHPKNVKSVILTMYITSGLIFIRCIFRVVEHFAAEAITSHVDNNDINGISPIIRFEWYYYVFEIIPMIAYTYLWNIRHPRHYLPQNHRVYLCKDGKTEKVGPGWIDDRGFVVTAVDPFGWFRTRKPSTQRPFWELDDEPKEHELTSLTRNSAV